MKTIFPKILITGGNGQLARALLASDTKNDCHALDRSQLDVGNAASVERCFNHYSPEIVINTAAFTAVDLAEKEKEQARRVNVDGAYHLAGACQKANIPLIHLSTDYVFNGDQQTPYDEEALPHPLNYYGKSKYLSEEIVRTNCNQHIILRVSALFSTYGNNFVKTILRLAQKEVQLKVIDNQFTCPTSCRHLATTLLAIANRPRHFGVFHYCNSPMISWFQFAKDILMIAQNYIPLSCHLLPISSSAYPAAAKRPRYSALSCKKIATVYDIPLLSWQEDLKCVVQDLLYDHAI